LLTLFTDAILMRKKGKAEKGLTILIINKKVLATLWLKGLCVGFYAI